MLKCLRLAASKCARSSKVREESELAGDFAYFCLSVASCLFAVEAGNQCRKLRARTLKFFDGRVHKCLPLTSAIYPASLKRRSSLEDTTAGVKIILFHWVNRSSALARGLPVVSGTSRQTKR